MKRFRSSLPCWLLVASAAVTGLGPVRAQSSQPALRTLFWDNTRVLEWDSTGGASPAKVKLMVDGEQLDLALSPVDVVAPGARWFVDDEDRTEEMEILCQDVRCYRGMVIGRPGGLAAVTVHDGGVAGVILPERPGDVAPGPREADPRRGDPTSRGDLQSPAIAEANGSGGSFAYVDIALDADVEFHQIYGAGSTPTQQLINTATVMIAATNVLDFIFQREVGIRYRISFGSVWTQEPDPYYSTNTKDLVNGMQAWWNQNRPWVYRDTAHLLSGKRMVKLGGTPQVGGGYPGYICDRLMAYSVSSVGQTYDPWYMFFNLVSNMAHEQGHQWSSGHCSGPGCQLMCGDPSCFPPVLEFEPLTRALIWNYLSVCPCIQWVPVQSNASDPDLIVSDIQLPSAMGLGLSHPVGVTIKNVGGSRAVTNAKIWTWLTLDGNPFSGIDDIPMGGPGQGTLFGGVNIDLQPGEERTWGFQSLNVPLNALISNQKFVACVDIGASPCGSLCEADESNNCTTRSVFVKGIDALVTSVTAPSSAVSGQTVTVRVTVKNDSVQTIDIPVGLTMCGPQVNTTVLGVLPQQERSVNMQITAPPSPANCGAPDPCSILACANHPLDTYRANDCMSRTIQLIDNFWDLQVSLEGAPSTACVGFGTWISWKVRVTNAGNMASGSYALFNQIDRYRGQGVYNNTPNVPITLNNLPSIPAGESDVWEIRYFLPGNTLRVTQYIKAEITAGDSCFAGNFTEKSIRIGC